jgi:hypothetical protein
VLYIWSAIKIRLSNVMKEHDPPKEPLRKVAQRKWNNESIRRRIIKERNRPKPRDVDAPPEPEIAETITNDGRRHGPINRLENKFKKEIRAMMEGHARNNMMIYAAYIERRRCKLLAEKLRRLKLAQQNQGG